MPVSSAPLAAALPELRKYLAQGLENSQRVGPLSEIASAVTLP